VAKITVHILTTKKLILVTVSGLNPSLDIVIEKGNNRLQLIRIIKSLPTKIK
jgi:hypothetical protein